MVLNQQHLQDVKSSFWDYSALILGKGGVLLLGFVVTVFITRLLGPESYGRFSLFFMVAQILMFGLVSWTSASVIRFGKEEYIKEKVINKVFWARTAILVPCFLIGSLAVLLFRAQISNYIGMPSWVVWFVIGHFLIYALSEFLYYIFQATAHLKTLAIAEFCETSLIVIGLLLTKFFIGYKLNILALIIGIYLFSKFAVNLFFLTRIPLKIFLPVKIDKRVLKRIFLFSYPLIFGTIAGYVSHWVDVAVVKKYLDVAQVGLYSLAFKIGSFLQYFGLTLNIVLLPMLVGFLSLGKKGLITLYAKRTVPQLMLFWSFMLFFIFILSRPLILLFFGKAFEASILPFSILVIGYTVSVFSILYTSVFTAFEMIKLMTIVNIAVAILGLGLDLLLVPLWGIAGASIARTIAFSVAAIGYFFFANRKLKLKEYKQFLIPLPFIGFFIVTILFPQTVVLVAGAIILLALMIIITKYLNLFSQEDKRLFAAVDMPLFLRKWVYKIIDKLSPSL